MLHRRMIVVPLLLLFLTTTGCTFFRSMDNSSPEEMQKFATSKDDLWNQTRALEKEKVAYQKQLADQQAEIDRMNRELAYWQTETAQADRRFLELNKTIEGLNAQIKHHEEIVQTTPSLPKETTPERKSVKIKVLAGDGKMTSAGRLSKKLGNLGYRVARIDRASRSDFKVNTIFFGSGYQAAAATLVKELGRGAVSTPLTWPSVFGIIIVTGRES
jgi:Skp family chaperone for outer membrane proteins